MDPRCPVGGSALTVDYLDLLRENGIEAAPLRRRTASPGVVAGARYLEHPAQLRDRVPCLLCLDEAKDAHRVPSSLAKKAAAFFRISRSSRRILTSLRRLRSS